MNSASANIILKRASHIVKKIFCFFIFGLGGVVITVVVFPLVTFIVRDEDFRNSLLRKIIKNSFHLYLKFIEMTGIIKVEWTRKELLESAEKRIICANHPTLLDVVFLIGTVNNANCIVKASLWKNPFIGGVISKIYIPNSLNPEKTLSECRKSLNRGENIILFPESTRTRQHNRIHFHRSAAHIALHTGHNILPVHIDVVWPTGIGKQDRLLSAPENGIIEFSLTVRENIFASYYKTPRSIAARQLTADLMHAIFV